MHQVTLTPLLRTPGVVRYGAVGTVAPGWLRSLSWGLAGVALLHALYLLLGWLNAPIIDQHAFRQTQTALTSYYLLQGGPFFAYETPVMGSPWTIPLELPIYQGLTALLAWAGVPLEAAGRVVSFAFFLAAIWPLRMLWRDLRLEPVALPIFCALMLASPEYAFWSRTFLMESCAWFIALLWLAIFVRYLVTGRPVFTLLATLIGTVAVCAKATTFPGFALLGGLLALPHVWRWLRAGLPRREIPGLAMVAAGLVVPFALGLVWVAFCDLVKDASLLGQMLSSRNMGGWVYGTLDQRISRRLWLVLTTRMLPDVFGPAWGLGLIILAGALCKRRSVWIMLGLVVAFIAPIAAFTNLHIVHNYYQYENAAFLLGAAAIGLGALAVSGRAPLIAAAALLVVFASQMEQFHARQAKWMAADPMLDPVYGIALAARAHTPPGSSLLVFGDDFSSTVPFYAQRRALAVLNWVTPEQMRSITNDPNSFVAGTTLAGVVDCPGASPPGYSRDVQAIVDAFLARRAVVAEYGTCRLLSADR